MILLIIAAVIAFGLIIYLYSKSSSKPIVPRPEIYCIGTNKYRYIGASDICRKMGGRLATKEELEKAYKAGADWCTLGWVEGLKAYTISHNGTTDCLSGFRGGSMPGQLKLGAVCYGIKPEPSKDILPWNSTQWSYYE